MKSRKASSPAVHSGKTAAASAPAAVAKKPPAVERAGPGTSAAKSASGKDAPQLREVSAAGSLSASPASSAFEPRVYEPGEIACCHQNPDLTNCGAQAGEPCRWQQPGMGNTYHAERVADAAAASQREGNKPAKEQFDQAAWDAGLF